MGVLTFIAAALIASPVVAWALGADPTIILLTHTAALVLTVRVFMVAARLGNSRLGGAAVGLFAGLMGIMAAEIAMDVIPAPYLATAFAAYGSFGPELFRLDVVTAWWPFMFAALNGIFYSGLAALIGQITRRRWVKAVVSRQSGSVS